MILLYSLVRFCDQSERVITPFWREGESTKMQAAKSHGIEWFVGSNGNLFGDAGGFRYCIEKRSEGGYVVARNGVAIATAPSVADAKILISRDAR